MRLFKPIIKMMGSLKDGQKFSFIGIILGIPIVILTILLITDLNHEINWKDERLKGVHYSKLLKDLLQDVQLHRVYSIKYIQGNKGSALKMEEKQLDILKDIEKIEHYNIEAGRSNTSERISQLYQQWNDIENKMDYYTPQQLTVLQNDYVLFITDFIEIIAGEYGLVLVEDEFTYYIINDVTKTLPMLTEQLGQIRVIGISSEGRVTDLEKSQQIISHISSAKRYTKELEHARSISLMSDSSYERSFDALSFKVIDDTYDFLDYIENEFLNPHFNNSIEEFINHATKTINTSFELYDIETNELENILSQQLKKLKHIRVLMFTFQIIAFILTVYSFFGFYFSIRNTMKEVREKGLKAENKYILTQQKLNRVEKKMSQKVMMAHEEERKRISRELHDSIGQSLYSILVKLNVVDHQMNQDEKEPSLKEIMEITEGAMKEIKRISQTLRPGILDDFGFIPALKSYIEDYKETYNIQVEFEFSGDKERLNQEIETQLYRICQEALTNVAKHAAAKLVHISISVNPNEILLILRDDGHGFALDNYLGDHQREGIGLFSMKERAESLAGTFEIYSKENQGTKIKIRIPRK